VRFSYFPVLPDSAEAHVISGGIVKWFLTDYFTGSIYAKISEYVHVFQSYIKAKVGRFLRNSVGL